MLDVLVIDDPVAAGISLDPVRARLLAALSTAGSASTLGASMGLSRQKANYHLRALEEHGLIELVEERRKGNCTERVLRATASSYVISTAVLEPLTPDPDSAPDQRSAHWLIALAARLVREVGQLMVGAKAAGKPLATFAIDSELRFASAQQRADFMVELGATVESLVLKYHDAAAHQGRNHRLIVAVHPSLDPSQKLHPQAFARSLSPEETPS